jgi:glycosyltransferase involved in cell wall biosynthesis
MDNYNNATKNNFPHPCLPKPGTSGQAIPLPRGEADDYSALLVNPKNPSQIAEAAYKLISDKALRDDIINRGHENAKRFSWSKCAEEIDVILKS